MPIYLKIDELQDSSDISPGRNLLCISFLALLMSPWALLGLALFAFNVSFITMNLVMICSIILIASLPKLFLLLNTAHKESEFIAQT